MAKLAEAMLFLKRGGRQLLPLVLVIRHGPSMTDPDLPRKPSDAKAADEAQQS
jgi:hypothetical protein